MGQFFLHSAALSLRGDTTNAQNLAILLRDMYGLSSVVVTPKNPLNSEIRIRDLRDLGIKVHIYENLDELHKLAKRYKPEYTYLLTNGQIQNVWVPGTKHIVHAVFNNYEPHGFAYAYVSKWLYKRATKNRRVRSSQEIEETLNETKSPLRLSFKTPVSWVPHTVVPIIGEKGSFREKFGIPIDAKLIIRIGGYDQFDDIAAQEGVKLILESNRLVFFIFVNTKPFYFHPRIRYIAELGEMDKWNMYADCDLAINGRSMGESFGFSIVEPLSVGKPVLAPDRIRHPRMDANHMEILRPLGLTFYTANQLKRKVCKILDTEVASERLLNSVAQYSPIESMSRFTSFFLEGNRT